MCDIGSTASTFHRFHQGSDQHFCLDSLLQNQWSFISRYLYVVDRSPLPTTRCSSDWLAHETNEDLFLNVKTFFASYWLIPISALISERHDYVCILSACFLIAKKQQFFIWIRQKQLKKQVQQYEEVLTKIRHIYIVKKIPECGLLLFQNCSNMADHPFSTSAWSCTPPTGARWSPWWGCPPRVSSPPSYNRRFVHIRILAARRGADWIL